MKGQKIICCNNWVVKRKVNGKIQKWLRVHTVEGTYCNDWQCVVYKSLLVFIWWQASSIIFKHCLLFCLWTVILVPFRRYESSHLDSHWNLAKPCWNYSGFKLFYIFKGGTQMGLSKKVQLKIMGVNFLLECLIMWKNLVIVTFS